MPGKTKTQDQDPPAETPHYHGHRERLRERFRSAGPDALSQEDCADILSTVLGRPIRAVAKPIEDFQRDAAAAGMPTERIEGMTKMNAHYDAHGLVGNPNVLRWLTNTW